MNTSIQNELGKLLTRLSLGVILLAHGLLKLIVFTPEGTVDFFASLGLPAITAYLTLLGEIGLGATLILGVATRLSAALSIPLLLGATWVHVGNGWVFSNAGGGWEFPALLVAMALIILIQGGGYYALTRFMPIRSNTTKLLFS